MMRSRVPTTASSERREAPGPSYRAALLLIPILIISHAAQVWAEPQTVSVEGVANDPHGAVGRARPEKPPVATTSAEGAVGASLKDWTDDRLFDSAVNAQRSGDCLWALNAYRALLMHKADSPLVPDALYGQALCFEQAGQWHDALDSYSCILEEHEDAPKARDALFRVGMLHERFGDYAAAERCYRRLLRHFDLKPPDRRAVTIQLGWERLRQGKGRSALRSTLRIVEEWRGYPIEELKEERFYIGKAHVILASLLSDYALEITFQRPPPGRGLVAFVWLHATGRGDIWLGRQLDEREARLKAARRHYADAIDQNVGIWVSAAYLLSGADYLAHYHALNGAPLPRDLAEDQQRLYAEMLREKTREYLVNASRLFHRGHELAVATNEACAWASLLTKYVRVVEASGVDGLAELNEHISGAFWRWDRDVQLGEGSEPWGLER